MGLLAFAAPILPGKTEQWKSFVEQLTGPRMREFNNSRQRYGVHERTFLQSTPEGDVVIVTLEGDDPAKLFRDVATSQDPFTRWFVQQVRELHGMDLTQFGSLPMPSLAVDSGEVSGSSGSRTEENKAIVRNFLNNVIMGGRQARWDEYVGPNYRNYINGKPIGRQEMEQVMAEFHRGFPDLRIEILDLTAEGDQVMLRGTVHGTHRGEFQGIPASSKSVEFPIQAYFKVADGKLQEDHPIFDRALLLQQLGVMPQQQRRAA